jgi:hypothetical protein
MAFNVYDMLGTLDSVGGLTKASKFLVRIIPPSSIQGDRIFEFLCEGAVLPGVALQTDEVKMYGYGTVNKRPYVAAFQDMPLSFFSDSDGKVFKFFHSWMQSIYNWNDNTPPSGTTARGLPSNTVAYPKDYYGTVEIIHYDDTGSLYGRQGNKAVETGIIKYTLQEAFPIQVGDIQMDWGMDDSLVKIPVNFAYSYWNA